MKNLKNASVKLDIRNAVNSTKQTIRRPSSQSPSTEQTGSEGTPVATPESRSSTNKRLPVGTATPSSSSFLGVKAVALLKASNSALGFPAEFPAAINHISKIILIELILIYISYTSEPIIKLHMYPATFYPRQSKNDEYLCRAANAKEAAAAKVPLSTSSVT